MEENMNSMPQEDNSEVDITEISLTDEEIDEWIVQLALLKATRDPISLEIDGDNELSITYDEGEENNEGGMQ